MLLLRQTAAGVPYKFDHRLPFPKTIARANMVASPKKERRNISLQCCLSCVVACLSLFIALSQTLKPNPAELSTAYISDELISFDALSEEVYPESQVRYEAYLNIFVRNADLDQPLLQSKENALPTHEFKHLQDCLRDHPMRHHNVNDDTTFNGTRGFLLSFNENGIEKMEKHDMFSCLKSYFRRYRLPNTNAWVLNMVWADIPDYERELTIQRHTDDGKLGFKHHTHLIDSTY